MNRGVKDFIGNESGVIAVTMALFMVALLGMGALVIDYGYMSVVQNDLKKAAEAGALSGALALGSATSPNWSAGVSAAEAMVVQNYAAGQLLTDSTVDAGYWDLSSKSFDANTIKTPSSNEIPAIQVVVARSTGHNSGPLQLSFAPILGKSSADLSGTAVAMITATSAVTGGWGILETGTGNVSITGAVSEKGSVGVNGNGKVTVSGSGSITGNLYVQGNGNVSLSGTGHVDGSAWQNGTGKFTMEGSAAVKGVAYLDDAVTQSFGWSTSINGHQYQGGSGFQSGDISSDASGASAAQTAAQAAQTAYNNFTSLTATDATGSISLSGTGTKTIAGTGGVNVLSLSDLSLQNSAVLTLNAPASGSFVIKVSNNFSLSGATQIVLQGGLTYQNVTFVKTGSSDISISNSAIIKGNILSPNAKISLTGAVSYSGTLIGGKDITVANSVHSPVTIPWLPSPSGSTAAARAYLVR